MCVANFFQRLLGAETAIRMTAREKFVSVFLVSRFALGLDIRSDWSPDVGAFIPIQVGHTKAFINHFDRVFDKTRLVRVFDAKKKLPVVLSGDQEGVQRRSEIADVHVTRRAWSVARANCCHRDFVRVPVTLVKR